MQQAGQKRIIGQLLITTAYRHPSAASRTGSRMLPKDFHHRIQERVGGVEGLLLRRHHHNAEHPVKTQSYQRLLYGSLFGQPRKKN